MPFVRKAICSNAICLSNYLFKCHMFENYLFKNYLFKCHLFENYLFKCHLFENYWFKSDLFKSQIICSSLLSLPSYRPRHIGCLVCFTWPHSKVRLIALTTNIIQGWKWLSVTKASWLQNIICFGRKKFYCTAGACTIKLFTAVIYGVS